MDAFSYLSVLISIILGLAVTQVLQGFRGLMLARAGARILAGTGVGGAGAGDLRAGVVGDVRPERTPRRSLDVP